MLKLNGNKRKAYKLKKKRGRVRSRSKERKSEDAIETQELGEDGISEVSNSEVQINDKAKDDLSSQPLELSWS